MNKQWRRILSLVVCFVLFFQQAGLAQVLGELNIAGYLPGSGGLRLEKFSPIHARYFLYDSSGNKFNFLLDKGDAKDLKGKELDAKSRELFKYFLIGLSLPNESFWVNLRPDSENQIIDPSLERTDIGKIFLEADVQLKKDVARLTSPATPKGKLYWDKLYKKANELFGDDNVTIPTLTRPWIVPGEVLVRHTDTSAYIYKANLKVMLEQDYLKDSSTYSFSDPRAKALNEYSSQLIREMIIPELTKQVNTSKRYSDLRQVFYSLILAQWFKAKYGSTAGAYAKRINSKDLSGLTSESQWSKNTYFQAYQKSFKDGEYNIKESAGGLFGQTIRTYFSGGIQVALTNPLAAGISSDNGILPVADALRRAGAVEFNAGPDGGIAGSPVAPSAASPVTPSAASPVVSPLKELKSKLGQRTWQDGVTAQELEDGSFIARVEATGIDGMTTNPTLVKKYLQDATVMARAKELAAQGLSRDQIYRELMRELAHKVISILGPEAKFSVELDPAKADDIEASVAEAIEWTDIDPEHMMVKVAATEAGIEVIRRVTALGRNVNATLIFSPEQYGRVAEAYVAGLEDAVKAGHKIGKIYSVASFFISRWDVKFKDLIPEEYHGMFANAIVIYAYNMIFKEVFNSHRFALLQAQGARVQDFLLASTGSKAKDFKSEFQGRYPYDVYFVNVQGDHVVNTLPVETIDKLKDAELKTDATIESNYELADRVLRAMAAKGVLVEKEWQALFAKGLESFQADFRSVQETLDGIVKNAPTAAASPVDSNTMFFSTSRLERERGRMGERNLNRSMWLEFIQKGRLSYSFTLRVSAILRSTEKEVRVRFMTDDFDKVLEERVYPLDGFDGLSEPWAEFTGDFTPEKPVRWVRVRLEQKSAASLVKEERDYRQAARTANIRCLGDAQETFTHKGESPDGRIKIQFIQTRTDDGPYRNHISESVSGALEVTAPAFKGQEVWVDFLSTELPHSLERIGSFKLTIGSDGKAGYNWRKIFNATIIPTSTLQGSWGSFIIEVYPVPASPAPEPGKGSAASPVEVSTPAFGEITINNPVLDLHKEVRRIGSNGLVLDIERIQIQARPDDITLLIQVGPTAALQQSGGSVKITITGVNGKVVEGDSNIKKGFRGLSVPIPLSIDEPVGSIAAKEISTVGSPVQTEERINLQSPTVVVVPSVQQEFSDPAITAKSFENKDRTLRVDINKKSDHIGGMEVRVYSTSPGNARKKVLMEWREVERARAKEPFRKVMMVPETKAQPHEIILVDSVLISQQTEELYVDFAAAPSSEPGNVSAASPVEPVIDLAVKPDMIYESPDVQSKDGKVHANIFIAQSHLNIKFSSWPAELAGRRLSVQVTTKDSKQTLGEINIGEEKEFIYLTSPISQVELFLVPVSVTPSPEPGTGSAASPLAPQDKGHPIRDFLKSGQLTIEEGRVGKDETEAVRQALMHISGRNVRLDTLALDTGLTATQVGKAVRDINRGKDEIDKYRFVEWGVEIPGGSDDNRVSSEEIRRLEKAIQKLGLPAKYTALMQEVKLTLAGLLAAVYLINDSESYLIKYDLSEDELTSSSPLAAFSPEPGKASAGSPVEDDPQGQFPSGTVSTTAAVPATTGGLDFKAINILTQPLNTAKLGFKLPPKEVLAKLDIENERIQLTQMMEAASPIMPSTQRVMEYITACIIKKKTQEAAMCLVRFFKLQEDVVTDTSPEFRQFLNVIESNKLPS